MKQPIACLSLALFLGLAGQQATATVISSSSACANGGSVCDSEVSNSISSTADAVFDSTNYARAKTNPGTIGVEARSDNSTSANASASWQDVWSPENSAVAAGFTPNIGFKYHLDGVIDPRFLDPNSADDVYMEIDFNYDFTVGATQKSFSFNACYDAGTCGVDAFLDGNDITSNIVYGTNAQGQTTFSLDYYQAPAAMAWYMLGCSAPPGNPYACFWGDSMSALIDIDPYNNQVAGDFNNSFFNTFSVELVAADADSMLVSEGGRRTTLLGPINSVPEPASLLLLGTGFAMMAPLVRRRANKQQA